MDSLKPLTPESAAAVWRRAAQLQAEAAQRLEERSRALSASAASADQNPQDLTIDEVRSAASEVGISPEFISLAIAELHADPAGELPESLQDAATRFLGTPERSIELSRSIDRPVTEVYAAMQRVLPSPPWELALRDVTGDPLAGGPMVFKIPEITVSSLNPTAISYLAFAVDVQQLQFVLRPLAGSNGAATEILLRTGLQRSVRRNYRFGAWSTRAAAVLGAGGGAALGFLALGLSAALAAIPIVAGGALLGGGTAWAYRVSYRRYLHKFTALLDEVLGSIAVHAKTGGSFAAPKPPSTPPNDSGSGLILGI